ALQHLPAQQRAVLILRDVLGFSGAEVAEALGTNPDAVYSALQRAHKTVDARLPERTQQAPLRCHPGDAVFAMPPEPPGSRGPDAVADFLRPLPMRENLRWRVIPTSANGQPAF